MSKHEKALAAYCGLYCGELVGCEVADFLLEAGKKVTLMRRGAEPFQSTIHEKSIWKVPVSNDRMFKKIQPGIWLVKEQKNNGYKGSVF